MAYSSCARNLRQRASGLLLQRLLRRIRLQTFLQESGQNRHLGQSPSFNGLNITNTYNSRLQPLEFKASSTGGNAIDITYSFVDPLTNHNASHVYAISNNLDTTRSQTFTYDQLNRITSALTTSTHATSPTHCWGENYTVDAWGNLQSIAATTNTNYTGCSQESGFSAPADGNNHLSGFSYDLSGNTTSDALNSYTWDAESQMKTAAGVTYTYDGDGRRVSKVGSKLYWYGSGGDTLAETNASGNTTAEYIFFGGKRIAMLPAGSTPTYYVEDLLRTSRVMTTNAGVVCYDADFYPFGVERPPYTLTCPQNNYKFEGKERDSETGNDDFGARYYSNRFGRWLSADWSAIPAPVPYANLSNPQTLNLYAMVSDDPESFADLDGHADDDIVDHILNFVVSAGTTWLSDNAFGAFRPNPQSVEGKLGQAVGDFAAQQSGIAEAEAGTAGVASSRAMALVPGGQEEAAGAAIVSEAAVLHGTATAAIGTVNLAKDAAETTSSGKPYEKTPQNKEQMKQGNAPTGTDGHPVELHHEGQKPNGPVKEMTRTEHRLGENFKKNHPNTGQKPSQINRNQAQQQKRRHWKDQSNQ